MELFATQYVPTYVSACNSKFSKSVWNEGELQKINTRISELQGLVTTENNIVIQGEANSSLNEVHNVIVAYYEAKKAASAGGYNGIQVAKQKIANAKKFNDQSSNGVAAEIKRIVYDSNLQPAVKQAVYKSALEHAEDRDQ